MSQTVIVFQDEAILAAVGREGLRPQMERIYKVELSGYGDPFARWKSGLSRLREKAGELKRVRLVLPSSMCQVKTMRLPYVKGKELDAVVKREMQETFRSEITDYAIIKSEPGKGVSLVAAGVEEGVLKQFLAMCRELTVEVSSVAAPMEGIQRVLGEKKESRDRTAIFLFFEEESLTSILMENGQYKYSGRNRLFAEPGTLDFGTEIARNVSGILQFQIASKSEALVTDLYYAGCKREDFEVSREELGAMNLTVHPFGGLEGVSLPAGERASDWLLCIGAMMCGLRGRKSMNLAASLEKGTDGEQAARTNIWKAALPVAVVLLVCVLIFAGAWVRKLSMDRKLRQADDWIEKTVSSREYKEAVLSEKEAEKLEQTVTEIGRLRKNLAAYPVFDTETLAEIEGAGVGISLKIRGYDAGTGVLTFDASSQEVIDIPDYIKKLEETELFHTVDYTGYAYENGVYTLSVLCTMESPQTGGAE